MFRLFFLLPLMALSAVHFSLAQEISLEPAIELEMPSNVTFNNYGAELDPDVEGAYGVSEVMADESLYNNVVNVQGTISDVCQKKGCWMVISDGKSQMRITFKDYGFFVPTDCSGKFVTVQGVVSVEEIPEDLAKHYAEESKGENPDEIEGPQRVVTMVATGVRMMDVE
ncbi:MAG: DUF4920 domain-containing protein [Candidatus Kapaibacterium sp.]